MKCYVYIPSENVKKKMVEYYQDKVREKKPPYSLFQAMDNDTTITMYEKGKVMFQGANCDMDFDMWAAVEKKNNSRDIYKDIDSKEKKKTDKKESKDKKDINYSYLKKISTIGSDEVGTGDYLGPIIVTAAYVPEDKIPLMKELNIGDSKKIKDCDILELGPKLIKNIVFSSQEVTNEKYNTIEAVNINKLKAVMHNKVLYRLSHSDNVSYEKIVIDQFVNEKKYYEYLDGINGVERDILFLTKAEDLVYSVAAASIISRYLFLQKMDDLSIELGVKIPLGSGVLVNEFAAKLVEKHGEEVLSKYAKLNFKNTHDIKALVNKHTKKTSTKTVATKKTTTKKPAAKTTSTSKSTTTKKETTK